MHELIPTLHHKCIKYNL